PAAVAVTGAVEPQVPVAALGRVGQVHRTVATGPEGAVDLRDELGTEVERRALSIAGDDVELDVLVVVAVRQETGVLPLVEEPCTEPGLDRPVALGGGLEDEVLRRDRVVVVDVTEL